MIIRTNKRVQIVLNSSSLFCTNELDGIELDGGDDDDFGDEILRRLPGQGGNL
jgi:hypothetical protein